MILSLCFEKFLILLTIFSAVFPEQLSLRKSLNPRDHLSFHYLVCLTYLIVFLFTRGEFVLFFGIKDGVSVAIAK
jgi:uncharacterized RDD family membrane protein YckC